MQQLPHLYSTAAAGGPDGTIRVSSPGLPYLDTAAPAEFGGPGDLWSPETMLVAAVADCFVLTFRAVARASTLEWTSLECEAEGKLDRADRITRFTEVVVRARLVIPEATDRERALRLLEKSERSCLVTNSMNAEVRLETEILTEPALIGGPVG